MATIIMLLFFGSWLFIYPAALFETLKFGYWKESVYDKFMTIGIYCYLIGTPIAEYFMYFR
jgi:hypothetical protein